MSRRQFLKLTSKRSWFLSFFCVGFAFCFSGCMSSKREEEIDKKIIELQSSTNLEVAKLKEELLKKDLALGNIKSSSEDASRRVLGTKSEMDDLRRQLNVTQGALDELNTKFNRFVDATTKSMSSDSATTDSQLRLNELENKTETLSAYFNLFKLQMRKREGKGKISSKMNDPAELDKMLSNHFALKDYKKTLSLTDQVLASEASPNAMEIALRYRAEAYFALQNYEMAALDLDDFLERFPNSSKQARILLLAGDSWIYLQNYKMAKNYYQKCIKTFPEKQECIASKERLNKIPGG